MSTVAVAKQNPNAKPTPSPFGVWLKQTRESKEMTLEALAEAVGVHRVTISKIESGTTQDPSLNLVVKLVEALGHTLGDVPT